MSLSSRQTPVPDAIPGGLCAITLGPPAGAPPALHADLAGWEQAVSINRFYRAGGEDVPVTPTEARVAWDSAALYVAFHCTEPNPRYQPVRRSGPGNPAFADSVTVCIRPCWDNDTLYAIDLASSGDHQGRRTSTAEMQAEKQPESLDGYEAGLLSTADGWTARIAIPWTAIGGKPDGSFGLHLIRARGQSSERLSPVPLDYLPTPADDLCLEVHFGETTAVHTAGDTLAVLPSGLRRWQLPATLTWPTAEERAAIWALQESLAATTPEMLAEYIRLAQRWYDLLQLEGFSFHPDGGCWKVGPGEYQPRDARRAVNDALRNGDLAQAGTVLDTLLRQFAAATRRWFADESPGNIRTAAWTPLDCIAQIICLEREMQLECRAGEHTVRLHLSCPAAGGIRLHAESTGFFQPADLLMLTYTRTPTGTRIAVPGMVVVIKHDPWTIIVKDEAGQVKWQLGRDDLAFRFAPDGTILAVDISNTLAEHEAIYGFGERFDAVNQRGRAITLYDLDAWEGTIYGLRNQMYKPVQLLHSTCGYSLFLNTTYPLRADVGQAAPDRLRLTAHGPVLDLFLWPGDPLAALQAYTDLTGKPVLPPKWAFEPWMGGGWGRWKHGPLGDPTAQMLEVTARFAALDIPHTAIYAEGEGSDDPRLFTALAPRNIRPFAWMNSHMGLKIQRELLPGVPDDELPILHRADGATFPYVDFTHPRAAELLRAYWKRRFDLGIAGTMVDFGDLVPDDAIFYDGRQGGALHNSYAYDYHRLYRQVFAERRGEDHVLFSRSAAPGSQHWLCQFAGDHQPNFVGLTAALYGGLNLSASGFSTWGCDIGGYMGWPDPETYLRWVQWGCFSPMMRCHGTEPREPWEFGDACVPIYKQYAWLRENLLDYIYSAAVDAHHTGIPLMRALPLAFPGDDKVAGCDDAYLFGPDLLVAPIHAGGDTRQVYFPTGRWTDFWTGEVIDGPAARQVEAPLYRIPLYLRNGAILPVHLNGALQWGESMTNDRVAALVITPPQQTCHACCWESTVAGADFTLTPTENGFILEMTGRSETRYLLIYGTPVTEVTVNGELLPLLDGDDLDACPPGWYVKGTWRVVVRLPYGAQQKVVVVAAATG
ncbi:MAG: TIM-barrel domain-containing protein [Armatimonadota bacterium]